MIDIENKHKIDITSIYKSFLGRYEFDLRIHGGTLPYFLMHEIKQNVLESHDCTISHSLFYYCFTFTIDKRL